MKKSILSFGILITAFSSSGQIIEANNVRAHIGNYPGRLFQANNGNAGYEVPKNQSATTIYTTSLWCAALDDAGILHLAAMRFGQQGNDFFAGPYSSSNSYQNAAYTAAYSTGVWSMSKGEIQYHLTNYQQAGYTMSPAIANWPGNGVSGIGVANNLAPFVDNNNNGIYEPLIGEYPDIRGDQAYYLIMNDAAAPHTETGGLPLGIEVHTMVYQYTSIDYKNQTTFLNYRVFNRSVNNYADFKVSLWSDFDLGSAPDDFMGCDVTNNMMYVYNADNNDVGFGSYGLNPPAAGISCLNKEMSSFSIFTAGLGGPYTDPNTPIQYYNFMQGLWGDGSTMYFGGNGTVGAIPTKFMFPGDSDPLNTGTGGIDPGMLWDEFIAANPPGDRRGVMTLEDVSLPAGAMECYDFAVLYSRIEGNDHVQNIGTLRYTATQAKTDYDEMSTFSCDQITLGIDDLNDEAQITLFPNPSNGEFNLSFGDQKLTGKIIVTDISGRVVMEEELQQEVVKKMKLGNKTGLFNVSIITDQFTVNKRLIINE
jgi:Secretion system C-terminal sorting domain